MLYFCKAANRAGSVNNLGALGHLERLFLRGLPCESTREEVPGSGFGFVRELSLESTLEGVLDGRLRKLLRESALEEVFGGRLRELPLESIRE